MADMDIPTSILEYLTLRWDVGTSVEEEVKKQRSKEVTKKGKALAQKMAATKARGGGWQIGKEIVRVEEPAKKA